MSDTIDADDDSNLLIEQVQAAIKSGDLFTAYDRAMAAIDDGAAATRLHYLAVLSLARMGATKRAHALYQKLRLCDDPSTDSQALQARLLKDVAFLATGGADASHKLLQAADAYYAIYEQGRDYFPGINAATLYFLSGDVARGQSLADELLQSAQLIGDDSYYGAATRAEALLLLSRDGDAADILGELLDLADGDAGAIATTRKQLMHIVSARGLDPMAADGVLSALVPKKVAHFCGHMVPSHMGAETAWQDEMRAAFKSQIGAHNIGIAYGALACGADIVFAEVALEMGVALVVVLPFDPKDFIEQSVAGGGADWVSRFDHCLQQAESVVYATEDAFIDDPYQFAYGSAMAMGLARLRADALAADCVQIAAWDGAPTDYPAGTAKDVALWRDSGGHSEVIRFVRTHAPKTQSDERTDDTEGALLADRVMRSIIFTDFKGFSKLPERTLPLFAEQIMGACADVLADFDDAVSYKNTWGDALFLIIDDIVQAARLALALQQRLAQVDVAALGLSGSGSFMRIGLHYGPVFEMQDPVTGRANYYGSQISRTARIEPITPPGAVYVTEAFAAILAMTPGAPFSCSYVGQIDLPKGFGTFRMYHLETSGSDHD